MIVVKSHETGLKLTLDTFNGKTKRWTNLQKSSQLTRDLLEMLPACSSFSQSVFDENDKWHSWAAITGAYMITKHKSLINQLSDMTARCYRHYFTQIRKIYEKENKKKKFADASLETRMAFLEKFLELNEAKEVL